MKRRLAIILEIVPGIIFWAALIFAMHLNLPFLRRELVGILITILGVLLGFWSVTLTAEIPEELATNQEVKGALRTLRFRVSYALVCGIVVSLITYLYLETDWGELLLIASGGLFYIGLAWFLWGYLVESGVIEWAA